MIEVPTHGIFPREDPVANRSRFRIDRERKRYAVFMVKAQDYRSPARATFRRMVNEALKR
ncbi:MAG: hypothetical protein ACKO9Z_03460 [Planctomycetota bacterium]